MQTFAVEDAPAIIDKVHIGGTLGEEGVKAMIISAHNLSTKM